MAYEPRVMAHPHARKGKITPIVGMDAVSGMPFRDSQGEPDVFPDVTVKDPETETYYRARGYLFHGEVPPPPAEYSEYPVMLVHPNHKDAVPDDWAVERGEGGQILRTRIPGVSEVFPPRQVSTAAEEADWGKKGYARAGHDDPDAIRTQNASPYVPGRVIEEFPKVENGVVVDPNAPHVGPIEYPKWVGDKLVNNRAEENALKGIVAPPAPAAPVRQPSAAALADGREPLKMTARQKRAQDRENKPATRRTQRQKVTAGE